MEKLFWLPENDEGQLCPYSDCQQFVPLTGDWGWRHCPHCGNLFWYREVDTIEDYHCFFPGERENERPDYIG